MTTHGSTLAIVILLGCAYATPQATNVQEANNCEKEDKRADDPPDGNGRSWKFATPGKLAENTFEESRYISRKYPHAVIYGSQCGGTIISPKWILTAAHCTLLTKSRTVLADPYNPDGGVSRSAKSRMVHPLFSIGPYWHSYTEFNLSQIVTHWDLMLVELDEPLPLNNKTMKAAALDDNKNITAGLEVSYAGFGTLHRGGNAISEDFLLGDIHEMKLAVEPDSVCSKLDQFEAKDLFCAKGLLPGDVVCPLQGDSGSGLVDNDGKLMGVASWVEDDARECIKGQLVFFSKVGAARQWIKNVTNI